MEVLTVDKLQSLWLFLKDWVETNVFVVGNLVQLLIIVVAFALSYYVAPRVAARLKARRHRPGLIKLIYTLSPLLLPITWAALLWLTILVASTFQWPQKALEIGASLVSAWVIIHLLSQLVRNPLVARLMAWTVWTIAALNILNLLDPTKAVLESIVFPLGRGVTLYRVIMALLALGVLLWLALYLSGALESRIRTTRGMSPSQQVLIGKLVKFSLVIIAILAVIQYVGIDLTALAVLSGAIGLGIGFGLQRVIGNMISGVILLMDRSIKPGDVIAVEDTYGWVNTLGGRYVSVITRDGVEHLIPNETLVTQRVENWTHSHSRTRLKIPIGIHYDSDVPKAIDLCMSAAKSTDRVLERPAPNCLLRGFGDNAVDLELRFWIRDPARGISNVKSEVLLKIWDQFQTHGIKIPYPQRDVHLQTSDAFLASSKTAS